MTVDEEMMGSDALEHNVGTPARQSELIVVTDRRESDEKQPLLAEEAEETTVDTENETTGNTREDFSKDSQNKWMEFIFK